MWTVPTSPASSPGATTQPMRQPIIRCSAVAHAVERGGMDRLQAVEQDALVGGPVQEPEAALAAERCDRLELFAARCPAGRERGVVDEDRARALAHRGA